MGPDTYESWESLNTTVIFYYVYQLQSETFPDRHYTGVTTDLERRLSDHNRGGVSHTRKFRPWRIEIAVAFREEEKAIQFEKYLKTSSGRAFAKRHF